MKRRYLIGTLGVLLTLLIAGCSSRKVTNADPSCEEPKNVDACTVSPASAACQTATSKCGLPASDIANDEFAHAESFNTPFQCTSPTPSGGTCPVATWTLTADNFYHRDLVKLKVWFYGVPTSTLPKTLTVGVTLLQICPTSPTSPQTATTSIPLWPSPEEWGFESRSFLLPLPPTCTGEPALSEFSALYSGSTLGVFISPGGGSLPANQYGRLKLSVSNWLE